jgi:hypothetical protein
MTERLLIHRTWALWAILGALGVCLAAPLLLASGDEKRPRLDVLHARLARALAGPTPTAAVRPGARSNDPAVRTMRRLLRRFDRRYTRDATALLNALDAQDQASDDTTRKLVEAVARLRADVRDLRERVGNVKARRKAGARARRLAMSAQDAAVTALTELQGYAASTDLGEARARLDAAVPALDLAQARAANAAARLGCRKTCGSGF